MYLTGKVMVFLICDIPCISEKVVEEIEKMLKEGARIRSYVISTDNQGKIRACLEEKLSRVEGLPWEKMIFSEEGSQEFSELKAEEFFEGVDLLVAAPCPPWLWERLVALRLPERVSLVVAPVGLDAGTRDLIYYLGDLLKKERTYFVPFGPVSLNPEEKPVAGSMDTARSFLSRMDLLRETTLAAITKSRIEPFIFECDTLPG